MQLPKHLTPATPACTYGSCACTEPLAMDDATGRRFITLGHAGVNTPANNRSGHASRESAKRAFTKYNTARQKHGAYLPVYR